MKVFAAASVPADLREYFEEVSADEYPTEPALVADIFLGSGTTAIVANAAGRRCIGIELQETYAAMAVKRLQQEVLL